jgi:hypothetical protein
VDASPRLRLARIREDEAEDGVQAWTRPLWLRLARVREDEVENGVEAWTRPGSSLHVSAKMKQRTAWTRGRARRRQGGGAEGMSDGAEVAGILLAAVFTGRALGSVRRLDRSGGWNWTGCVNVNEP